MTDSRNDLWQDLSMCLVSDGVSGEMYDRLQMDMQIVLDKYEIMPRTTELSVCCDDQNFQLIKRFIMAKTVAGRTEKTIAFYNKQLNNIITAIGKNVAEIQPDDIRYYLALRMRRDGISKVTLQNEWRVLSTFFQWLAAEGIVQQNPMLKVESVKAHPPHEEPFSEMDIEKIRNCLTTNREKAIVEVMLSTGCRVGELVKMKIQELDTDKIVVHGKGEKDRIVYLNAKAIMALQKYLDERTDKNPYIFPAGKKLETSKGKTQEMREWYKNPDFVGDGYMSKSSVESMMRRIGKCAGIENVHPHRFRKTCATMALRRGMPLEKVSKMLGHASLETTKIYISISEDEMEQAHKKYVI